MGVVLRNNVFSVLTVPLGIDDVVMVVSVLDAELFPPLDTPGEYTYATISAPGAPILGYPTAVVEIVKITARSSNAMVIVRGQDDTAPAAFPEGAVVALRINAASVMDSFITNYDVLLL